MGGIISCIYIVGSAYMYTTGKSYQYTKTSYNAYMRYLRRIRNLYYLMENSPGINIDNEQDDGKD